MGPVRVRLLLLSIVPVAATPLLAERHAVAPGVVAACNCPTMAEPDDWTPRYPVNLYKGSVAADPVAGSRSNSQFPVSPELEGPVVIGPVGVIALVCTPEQPDKEPASKKMRAQRSIRNFMREFIRQPVLSTERSFRNIPGLISFQTYCSIPESFSENYSKHTRKDDAKTVEEDVPKFEIFRCIDKMLRNFDRDTKRAYAHKNEGSCGTSPDKGGSGSRLQKRRDGPVVEPPYGGVARPLHLPGEAKAELAPGRSNLAPAMSESGATH